MQRCFPTASNPLERLTRALTLQLAALSRRFVRRQPAASLRFCRIADIVLAPRIPELMGTKLSPGIESPLSLGGCR